MSNLAPSSQPHFWSAEFRDTARSVSQELDTPFSPNERKLHAK